ncbi:hypothetical protein BGZ50_001720 [Haplosporangium sp. Z 11]|nr:hypothetical protein BGZ50_001720 [Haplosporangium sp. Z 11]
MDQSTATKRPRVDARPLRTKSPLLICFTILVSAACAQVSLSTDSPLAYDPLISVADQLMIPVAAGVPPHSSASLEEAAERQTEKENAYILRLETERVQRHGSFYLEPLFKDTQWSAASVGRPAKKVPSIKEPLPWEEFEEEHDDTFKVEEWPLSPSKGEFPYKMFSMSKNSIRDNKSLDESDKDLHDSDGDNDDKQFYDSDDGGGDEGENDGDGDDDDNVDEQGYMNGHVQTGKKTSAQNEFSAATVNNDNGATVVDDQGLTRLDITTKSYTLSVPLQSAKDTKTEKVLMAESESQFDTETTIKDPNVQENMEEAVIDSNVWNAVGISQKKQEEARSSREYIVRPEDGEGGKNENEESLNNWGAEAMHANMDQIDFMGHEAEVEWLQEHDAVQRAWRVRHRRKNHQFHDNKESELDNDSDNHGMMGANWINTDATIDPLWDYEHGGLDPKHYRLFNHGKDPFQVPNRNKIEKKDRDEDGTVFPDIYSDAPYSKIVYPTTASDPDSPLSYVAYNHQGDRIIDFSMVGWNEGNTGLPDPKQQVPVIEQLFPRPEADSDADQGDDTNRIQRALNRVAENTRDTVGSTTVVPTGALVLARGVYRISRPLKIRDSGILFRGDPTGGSRIVCQWEPTGPRYAIEIEGQADRILEETRIPIVTDYTPVGSFYLTLDPTYFHGARLKVGDQVIVSRIGNERWVQDIGMDDFNSDKEGVKPWKKMRARMYRTIRALNPKTGIVQLDAPLPISIQRDYGGGWITKYEDRKIRALGIQFLDMVFPQNIGRTTEEMLDEEGRGSKDYRFSFEIFANYALRIDRACHVYFSHITSAYFHNFISIGTDAHHMTLESVVHSYPDEMLSGQSAFQLSGQLILIKNSLSQGSFHPFVDISHVMGPNVVHRAQVTNVGRAYQAMPLDFAPGDVGPHMKYCTGILFDQIVTDGSIQIVNRGDMGTGQGYSGANSVVWNSRAREGILTHRPRGSQNFVIGSEDFEARDRQLWDSHGWKEHLGSEVLPGSLYIRQLHDRLDRLAKGWVA